MYFRYSFLSICCFYAVQTMMCIYLHYVREQDEIEDELDEVEYEIVSL